MADDSKLIKAALGGDRHAAQGLVHCYYQAIFSFVFRMVGDWHLALDLTQDVFVKALSALAGYRQKGKFSSWLLAIASNRVRDHWRRQSRYQTQTIDGLDIPSGEQLEEAALLEESGREIKAALETLSPVQREVVVLRYYHDMKLQDIAEVTKANLSTVKSRLRLGLMALKQVLSGGDMDVTG
jgi:RNA polymerase sigma-70 factor (ECF subfamily)